MQTHNYTDEQGRRLALILPTGATAPETLNVPMDGEAVTYVRSDLKAVVA